MDTWSLSSEVNLQGSDQCREALKGQLLCCLPPAPLPPPSAHTPPVGVWWLLPLTGSLLKHHLSEGFSRTPVKTGEMHTPRAFVRLCLAAGRRVVLNELGAPSRGRQPDGARPHTVEPPGWGGGHLLHVRTLRAAQLDRLSKR